MKRTGLLSLIQELNDQLRDNSHELSIEELTYLNDLKNILEEKFHEKIDFIENCDSCLSAFQIDIISNSVNKIANTLNIPIHHKFESQKLNSLVRSINELGIQLKHQKERAQVANRNLNKAQKIAKLGYWSHDIETDELNWSDEIFNIFQIENKNQKLKLDDFIKYVHPDDREKVLNAYDLLKVQNSYKLIHRLLLDDKSIKYVEERGEVEYSKNGTPLRSIGTVQDVTDSIINEFLAKDLFNANEIGVAVIAGLHDFDCSYFLNVNSTFSKLLGYSEGEMDNKLVKKLYIQEEWNQIPELVQNLRDKKLESYTTERNFYHKDGYLVPINITVTPVWGDDSIDLIILKTLDLKDHKKAKHELSTSIKQLELINNIIDETTNQEYTTEEIFSKSLNLITDFTNFDLANLCAKRNGKWESNNIWYQRDEKGSDFEPFIEFIENTKIDAKEGIPNRVETSKRSVWIEDFCSIIKEIHKKNCNTINIKSAFAIPVWKEGELKYILQFFSSETKKENEDILKMSKNISTQITSIIEKKEVEDQKAVTDNHYKLLSENTLDIVMLHDPDCKVIWHSPSANLILGYDKEELKGVDGFTLIHPEDLDKVKENLHAPSIQGKKIKKGVNARLKSKNGKYIWFDYLTKPILNGNGEVINIISTARENTDTVFAKLALEKSETTFRYMIEHSADIVSIYDTNGIIKYRSPNTKKITGYSAEEMIDQHALDFIPQEEHSKMHSTLKHVLKSYDQVVTTTYHYRKKNGDLIWLETSSRKIKMDGEDVIIANSRDVTERVENLETERKLVKEQEVLIREVHHRVKNNLQIISGLIQMQKKRAKHEDSEKELTETIARIQSIALIHEMLYQSKLFSEINFDKYLINLASGIFKAFSQPNLHVEFIPDLQQIKMDVEKSIPLGILTNELITNSLKHAFTEKTKDPQIKITLTKKGKTVVLSIEDNGKGMCQEDIDTSKSLGIRLIEGLSSQIKGKLSTECTPGKGVKTTIEFNI